jgi:hypothetical protein
MADIRKIGFAPLSKAVYARLTTHALTLAYRVFTHMPVEDKSKNISWPYVVIGSHIGIRSFSFTTRDTNAEDNSIQVSVRSKYKGDKEASEMMDNICQALLSSPLTITGYDNPYLALLELANIFTDGTEPSDIVYNGVIRFRFDMGQA